MSCYFIRSVAYFTGSGDATAALMLAWTHKLSEDNLGIALRNTVASVQVCVHNILSVCYLKSGIMQGVLRIVSAKQARYRESINASSDVNGETASNIVTGSNKSLAEIRQVQYLAFYFNFILTFFLYLKLLQIYALFRNAEFCIVEGKAFIEHPPLELVGHSAQWTLSIAPKV
jgi:hypothetical protein